MQMPVYTHRFHVEPPWLGDRFAGLDAAHRHGYRYMDTNYQVAWVDPANHRAGCEIFALHWSKPKQNNFLHIFADGRVRPMTRRELSRPILRWPAAQVKNWRRGDDRPRTYEEMARHAMSVGVLITAELKSTAFVNPLVAQHFVASAKAAGHPPWGMALWKSMPGCRRKCKALIEAGGQFAVILGRFQRYRRAMGVVVRRWRPKPTRIW